MPENNYTHKPGTVREMVSLALPMVVSLSCDTLMIFTNRLFLSKISPEAMNAAMGGGIAAFQCSSFFVGLIGFTTALVAQQYGAGERAGASRAAYQAILVALAVWPLLACLAPLSGTVFNEIGIAPGQARMQSEYFSILIKGLSALVMNAFASWVLIFGHLGFDPIGIRGAGFATILGTMAGLAFLFGAYFNRENRKSSM